ncbi:MAG: nitrate reductase associated protein [Pararobbsia sp.]
MTSAPTPFLFSFEAAQAEPLAFIPLGVRFYLDRCGARLSLAQWQALPEADRAALASFEPALDEGAAWACEALLETLSQRHPIGTIERQPPSPVDELAPPVVPATVVSQAAQHGIDGPAQAPWDQLSVARRYALTKLARKARRSDDFAAAAREFGLA